MGKHSRTRAYEGDKVDRMQRVCFSGQNLKFKICIQRWETSVKRSDLVLSPYGLAGQLTTGSDRSSEMN